MRPSEVNRVIERYGGVLVGVVGAHRCYARAAVDAHGRRAVARTAVPQLPDDEDVPLAILLAIQHDLGLVVLDGDNSAGGSPTQGGSPARRILQWATALLPPTARARYWEELNAELYELARSGTSRWSQVAYSMRMAAGMWSLRQALRAPLPTRERAR